MNVVFVVCSIIYVICSLFLIFVVLIQKGEGGGLGGAFGGGAVDKAFGSKADTTWKRATSIAASVFFVLAIFLGILQNHQKKGSIAGRTQEAEQNAAEGGTGVSDPLSSPGMEGVDEPGTLVEEPANGGASDGGASDGATDGGASDGGATDGGASDAGAGDGADVETPEDETGGE